MAGYVDFRQSLGTWLTLDAGLRVDRHSHVGTEWVPQAGVSFHLPRSAEIKLSAGKGFRYPTIRELYMFRPANPDLRPERLWSYELSLSQRLWEGRLSYGVNLFHALNRPGKQHVQNFFNRLDMIMQLNVLNQLFILVNRHADA